jgi:MFS transporter, CP family, cyanate transporter
VSAGAPKIVSLWFKGRERGLAMGIYITGPALGSILVLSSTNSVLMPWLAGDWRKVLQLWAGLALLGALVWLAICLHPAVTAMDRRTSSAPRSPQREVLAQLVNIPAVRVLLVMSVGIFMFNHGLNNWLPELLRADGMTAKAAGYWATVPTAVGIVGSLLIPRLATPERRFLILVGLCVSAGLGTILLHSEPGMLLFAGLVAQGIARSSLMTIAMLTLVETKGVGERHAGTAGGLFFSAAEIGGATGPIAMGALYDVTGNFHSGLTLLTGISALLLVGALRLRRLARQPG